jgi:hypothetical protein
LGGNQQIGSRISEGQIDFVILFSDPLKPQPHDADVKALLRIALVWNIPVACNRASADFIISSPLMSTVYERKVPDYPRYRARLAIRRFQGDVVDASVTPSLLRGNTSVAAIAIAEKAADILTRNVPAERRVARGKSPKY